MIGHFTDDDRVLEFINSNDLARLAPMGTSCPDHFLRTKISPLVLDLTTNQDLEDVPALKEKLAPQFESYRKMYADYYDRCKHANSPAMRDANPVVILYPGVGMFTFSKDKQTARVAAEFYINAINVMKGAEAFLPIPHCHARKHSILNTGCWKKQNCSVCQSPKLCRAGLPW